MSTAGQRRRKRRRETPFPPLFATHFGDDFFCRQLLHGFVSNPPSATLLRVFREFRPYPTPARFRALSLQSNFGKSVLLFRRLTLPRGETPGRLAKRDSAGWLALLARLRRAPMEQKDPSNKQIRSLEVQYGGKELSDALPRHMRASLWTRNSRQVHAFARNKLCRKRRGNILETTLYPKTKKKNDRRGKRGANNKLRVQRNHTESHPNNLQWKCAIGLTWRQSRMKMFKVTIGPHTEAWRGGLGKHREYGLTSSHRYIYRLPKASYSTGRVVNVKSRWIKIFLFCFVM